MLIQYTNQSITPDYCEKASDVLLTPVTYAFGRKIDIQTSLKIPEEHIITRVSALLCAILLLPLTLLGIALRFASITHWKHTSTTFKPVAVVISKYNSDVIENQTLAKVVAACCDIGESEPNVIELGYPDDNQESYVFSLKDETLEVKNLYENYTVIFLSSIPESRRIFECFQHDGWFSSAPKEHMHPDQHFAIIHHQDAQKCNVPDGSLSSHSKPDSYVVRTHSVIPTVIWKILQSTRPKIA
jgi:hypothetical protein